MSTQFSLITEDFDESLTSLAEILSYQGGSGSARARVAAVHATTLLLSATFEEYVREMAREFATQIVNKASGIAELPDRLLEVAWYRTLDHIVRDIAEAKSKKEAYRISASRARPKLEALWKFMEGDITQNIFAHLIHNENNMRPGEINKLFKVSGLSGACEVICKGSTIKNHFMEEDEGKTHGHLLSSINAFMDRRNTIAHSLNSANSQGPEDLLADIEMFRAFSFDLCSVLEARVAT